VATLGSLPNPGDTDIIDKLALEDFTENHQYFVDWVDAHRDSAIMKQAIQAVLNDSRFRDLLQGKGRPKTPTFKTPPQTRESYKLRLDRWRKKRRAANDFARKMIRYYRGEKEKSKKRISGS
jgi:phenylpropionate dioxygenase-like ring-hydroxylating dioxygenase large terminal subunit